MRRAYAILALCLAPLLAAFWQWPAGAAAMALAAVLECWPAILAAMPRNRRRARLAKLLARSKAA
jgi:hypothetical protein